MLVLIRGLYAAAAYQQAVGVDAIGGAACSPSLTKRRPVDIIS